MAKQHRTYDMHPFFNIILKKSQVWLIIPFALCVRKEEVEIFVPTLTEHVLPSLEERFFAVVIFDLLY